MAQQNPKKFNLALPIVVGVILLGALGFVVAGFLKKGSNETDTSGESTSEVRTGTSAGTASSADDDSIASLIEQAKAAHEKNQYVDPEGTNEVELYLRVLEKDPNNRIAQEALLEVIPFATDQAESYIRQGNIPQAERTLALLRKADPNSVVLISLAGKIEQLRRTQSDLEAQQIAQQQQAALAAQQRAAAQQAAGTETTTDTTGTETAATTPTEEAPTAATRPATTTARPAATETRPPPTTVASTTPPPTVNTPPVDLPEDRNFQLVKRVDPTYPQRALRQRITGWVEMSFTVTANGDVTDVQVVNSQPRREFDREATRALSQWKFKPKIEGGKPVAASARQRLEFRL